MPETGKLIAVLAFDMTPEGDLAPVGEGEQCPTEMRAKIRAAQLGTMHAGAIAWSKSADPTAGDYEPPTVLARVGHVPATME